LSPGSAMLTDSFTVHFSLLAAWSSQTGDDLFGRLNPEMKPGPR